MGIEATVDFSILDDSLGIDWRIPTEHANLSEKDTKHQVLKEFESPFEKYMVKFLNAMIKIGMITTHYI